MSSISSKAEAPGTDKTASNLESQRKMPLAVWCMGGNFDVRRTACKHENIAYIARYQGMTKKDLSGQCYHAAALRAVEETSEEASPTRGAGRGG